MNVFLTTLGCRLNEAEITRWGRAFRAAGHRVVADVEDADAVVLNSCAVTSDAAKTSRQLTRKLHRRAPTAPIVMTGCYATLEPERVAELTGVDLVVPNGAKDDLPALVSAHQGMPAMATEPAAEPFAARRTRGFVKVQDGCRHRCSFCIVTVARGEERSRTIPQVVDDVRALEAEGVREVVLSGVHLGGYGSDIGVDLRRMIEAVLTETTVPRIRFGSLEPWNLPDGFFDLWSDRRLCPHLHLPLQSGADSVLRRMARRCSTAEFGALAQQARERIEGFHLTTDLIVGFPGETEHEFERTMAFVESVGFGHVHAFTYSPRQGTVAARMAGQVPGDVKRGRMGALRDLAARMKAERLAASLSEERDVLWEGEGEAVGGSRVRWRGYTDNWLRVEASAEAGEVLRGNIERVRLEAVVDGERLSAARPTRDASARS